MTLRDIAIIVALSTGLAFFIEWIKAFWRKKKDKADPFVQARFKTEYVILSSLSNAIPGLIEAYDKTLKAIPSELDMRLKELKRLNDEFYAMVKMRPAIIPEDVRNACVELITEVGLTYRTIVKGQTDNRAAVFSQNRVNIAQLEYQIRAAINDRINPGT